MIERCLKTEYADLYSVITLIDGDKEVLSM